MPGPRVVIVGGGFGGIATAIELQRHGVEDVTLLERGPRLGGTWHYNDYPGCACDVPSHLYSFSFASRRDCSRLCSPQTGFRTTSFMLPMRVVGAADAPSPTSGHASRAPHGLSATRGIGTTEGGSSRTGPDTWTNTCAASVRSTLPSSRSRPRLVWRD